MESQLKDFPANRIPLYAILSHTWEEDEVLFTDMETGRARDKAGYPKVQQSCKKAAIDGFESIWIDTCCIDEKSSAELSEAINCMYSWYKNAGICFAYLADFPIDAGYEITLNSTFSNSRWFTRGWTLQELLAPLKLMFLLREWNEIGTKSGLSTALAEITGIDVGILTGDTNHLSVSIAKRMSWATHRVTTRVEDIAYCLMGIFEINIPLLYGEGGKAFIRLQEEIMKNSDDHTLFAWTEPSASAADQYGVLAKSPANFADSRTIVRYPEWTPRGPHSMTNKGLGLDLKLTAHNENLCVAALNCPVAPDYKSFFVYEGSLGIFLQRLTTGDHQYVRVRAQELCKNFSASGVDVFTTIYVPQSILPAETHGAHKLYAFQLQSMAAGNGGYRVAEVFPPQMKSGVESNSKDSHPYTPGTRIYNFTFRIIRAQTRLAGAILLKRSDGKGLVILLGTTKHCDLGFECHCASSINDLSDLKNKFNPYIMGTRMVVEDHELCVNVHPTVDAGAKYNILDIDVNAISHKKPLW